MTHTCDVQVIAIAHVPRRVSSHLALRLISWTGLNLITVSPMGSKWFEIDTNFIIIGCKNVSEDSKESAKWKKTTPRNQIFPHRDSNENEIKRKNVARGSRRKRDKMTLVTCLVSILSHLPGQKTFINEVTGNLRQIYLQEKEISMFCLLFCLNASTRSAIIWR